MREALRIIKPALPSRLKPDKLEVGFTNSTVTFDTEEVLRRQAGCYSQARV